MKFNKILKKLLLSYAVIIIIVTFTVGFTSYLYFSNIFNGQLENINDKMLEQVDNSIEKDILSVVTQFSMDLSLQYMENTDSLYKFDDDLLGNSSKVYTTYRYLQKLVSNNTNTIDAVHIYFKKSNLIISSSFGIAYLNEENNILKNVDWIDVMKNNEKTNAWLQARRESLNDAKSGFKYPYTNMYTYAHSYPISSSGNDAKGYIAIDIKENTFSTTLEHSVPASYKNTFIIDDNNKIICHYDKSKLYKQLESTNTLNTLLKSNKAFNSTIDNFNGIESLIAYNKLGISNWKIVNVTPIDQFYKFTSVIRNTLILICFFAIIIGVMLSSFFTKKIYNPLKIMINRIKSILNPSYSEELPIEDEYGIINNAINTLSLKVSNLEKTIENNKIMIKHNLLYKLFHNQITSKEQLEDTLKLINIENQYSNYLVAIFNLNQKIMDNLTVENNHFIKYSVIDKIETINNDDIMFHCIEMPDYKIAALVGFNGSSDLLNTIFLELTNYFIDTFKVPCVITYGTNKTSLLEVSASYDEADILQNYKFFFPEKKLLHDTNLIKRELSKESIMDDIILEFEEALNGRDLLRLEKELDTIIKSILNENYATQVCFDKLVQLRNLLYNYMKNMQFIPSVYKKDVVLDTFSNAENIYEFKTIIVNYALQTFQFLSNKSKNKTLDIIEEVKRYVNEHLSEDICLDILAEKVNISPKYLSKIFKEISGTSFVTFVTNQRMEKAKELLQNTDINIQDISIMIGYNSSAYFIKQFKITYGYTPNDFRSKYSKKAQLCVDAI